jgi:hypothetical protein
MSTLGPKTQTDPITGEPKKRTSPKTFVRDRPASQLAAHSMRPVEEVTAWCEQGKLKGYKSPDGEWIVWGSQLDKWRQLIKENPR